MPLYRWPLHSVPLLYRCCTAHMPPLYRRRYDVEQFQKIEFMTGIKMEAFPAERDEVR